MQRASVGLWAPKKGLRSGAGRKTVMRVGRRKSAILFALILALTASPLFAQDSEWLGERVRLTRVDGKKFRGTLTHLTPEVVHLQRDKKALLVMERSQLVRIERSLGRQRHFDRFFFLGFFSSVGVGALIDHTPNSRSDPTFAVIGGTLVGVPVGVLAGTFLKTEAWEPTTLPRSPEISISAFRDGRLGLNCAVPVSW